jgi:outer membrane protein
MMMKHMVSRLSKRVYAFAVVALGCNPLALKAQEQGGVLRLSLDDAKIWASKNNALVRAAQLDEAVAQKALAEQKWKRIPQIYADYNLQRNLIIPVTPVPANAFDPAAPPGEVIPMRFATDWSSNAGINGAFELFNPQRRGSVQEAKINQRIAHLDKEQTVLNAIYDAAGAYINTMVAAEQLRLAIADTVSKWALWRTSKQQYDEGRLLLATLNQVIADRNAALNNLEQARDIYEYNKLQLLLAIGVNPDTTAAVELVDDAESLLSDGAFVEYPAQHIGLAYRKQKENDALLQTQMRTALLGHLPTVQLKGYYGANYFDNDFDLLKSANWYGNSFVNLGIRLPLTEGLDRHQRVAQLKLKQEAAELRFQHEQSKNRLEYAQALREVRTFEKNIGRFRENFRLAETNLRLAEQQFAEGRLKFAEFQQALYTYQREKNSYLNFVFDYFSARLKAEKLSLE